MSKRPRPSRRDVLRFTATGAAAVALAPFVSAEEASSKKIAMGFIGVGARGTVLLRAVLAYGDVEVPAICDIDQQNLTRALDIVEKARGKRPHGYSDGPQDYRRLLERDDVNSVLIATPQDLHAAMTLDSMKAGKFVGAEVPACCWIDECHELVRARRDLKAGYMMLENLIYPRFVMQVQHMVEQGLFGDLTYGLGNYIHDLRDRRFNPDGSLTWRGENLRDNVGVIYPTHAIGPVCRNMGIGKQDKLVSLVAMASKPAATHAYALEEFGADSPAAKVDFKNGDTNHALIRTALGRLIEVRYDTSSPRPIAMTNALQGTRGAYEAAFGKRMVHLAGRSPQNKWEPLEKYEAEFQHPRWKAEGAKVGAADHQGGDYFVIADFLEAIRSGQSPIDLLEAVTWSCIRPLSAASILGGSKPVEILDFAAPA
jgi:predicted dehydrogenase